MTEIVPALKTLRRYGEWAQQGREAALQGSERLLTELIQAEATDRAPLHGLPDSGGQIPHPPRPGRL